MMCSEEMGTIAYLYVLWFSHQGPMHVTLLDIEITQWLFLQQSHHRNLGGHKRKDKGRFIEV